jgi:short-subunit dehydrogenase
MVAQKVALVTGASSGIGAEFARQLAGQGYDLILVARCEERLAALAASLARTYGVGAEIQVADLTRPAELAQVERRINRLENLAILVNNAGFGTTGSFAEIDLGPQLDMVHLHILACMRLCRAALPGMIARRRGRIINVSSMAGLVPLPENATYCATKAFLNSFSEALQAELAGTGVRVQALCPGFTHTEFHSSPEFERRGRQPIPGFLWLSAPEVVATSLNALKRNQVIHIPGIKYKFLALLIHLTPARLRRWVLTWYN